MLPAGGFPAGLGGALSSIVGQQPGHVPTRRRETGSSSAPTRLYDDQEGVARVYATVEDWLDACDGAFAVHICRQKQRHLRSKTSGS